MITKTIRVSLCVSHFHMAAVRSREKFGGRSLERSCLVGILKNKIVDYTASLAGRGCKRLSFERGGESRAHRHRQRLACRRSSAGPSELKVVPVTLMSGCSAPGKPNLVVSRIEIVRA